jgi:RNA polymerase sigma-70 factor (ECF subfamily)
MSTAASGALGMPDDEDLVDRARHGDPAAREELFRRHFPDAHRVALRLLGHEQDAQDAVQDSFLKAIRHLDAFDGRSGFRTWLLRVVTNSALDLGRKRKRRKSLSLDTVTHDVADYGDHDNTDRRLRREDLRQILDRALSGLKPAIRATFVLFAEAELSYKEIADVQNIPVGTVMSRLHFARHKLQGFLEGVEF